MIEVKNVIKSFEDKTVLKGINATFYDGKTNPDQVKPFW